MIETFKNMTPKIGHKVLIAPDSVIIGDVTIGDETSIWFQCIVRGDVNWIEIGSRVNIQDKCCLHVTVEKWPLLLEDEVSVAHNVMLHGCTIRKGALIGMSTTIMDGAEVGEGCLVAAGSLLREGFKAPPHTLVAGWPAVVKRDLNQEQKDLVASIWQRYVKYKDAYAQEGRIITFAHPNIDQLRYSPGFPRN
ncbi:MAG: gamma carbonic anhydrase family protein [Holophagaceae bacterium]|jgi:carbonic anhydrase/acetyltransferase-like protein (isoleucine patch superfamily)|nr:gamma carbonic anhydrase family protein [Holophagaceae bacterium]